MGREQSRVAVLFCVAALLPTSRSAEAQTVRHIARTDSTGMWIDAQDSPASITLEPMMSLRGEEGILWHVNDEFSITQSVALSDNTDETWVGHNLNFHRLAYHQTTGDGTPIYEHGLDGLPDIVAVGSAETVSLGVVLEQGANGSSVRAFNNSSGDTPLWTFSFPANYNFSNLHNVDVSADGSMVAAVMRDTLAGNSLVVILDGPTGDELQSLVVDAGVLGVELSDSGSRAVLTEFGTARIIATGDMSTLFSFSVIGAGGYHRISRNGLVVAAGGFDYAVYRDMPGGWTLVSSGSEANQWFGNGIALSESGNTMFLVTHNYATGYLDLTYRVIDLVSDTELAQTSTLGTGGLQDTVQIAQASANGHVFAIASWGTEDNVHPEVQVFDRELNLIGSVDTPGSPFDIDLTGDGRLLAVGSKTIHANTFGHGSDTYTYQVADPCASDVVDLSDYAAFTACFTGPNNGPAADGCTCFDTDGDNDIDLPDFGVLQTNFTGR